MSTGDQRILLIEDDPQIRRFLRVALVNSGYGLLESETGNDGLMRASSDRPHVVVLDLGLPDMDGQEVISRLRSWSNVPIIVLSARGRERDKINALDAGADDYLTKPFETNELFARIRAVLRRSASSAEEVMDPVFIAGDLRVDLEHRKVFVADVEVRLTPTEFRLLGALVKRAGKVVTHRQLLKDAWGPEAVNEGHYVRIYMGHLRHKIEKDSTRPRYLLTEPGVGYRLATE